MRLIPCRKRIDVWFERLGCLAFDGLEKLTNLKQLHLDNTGLTSVPSELEKLTKLEYLGLTNNQLTSVAGLEKLQGLVRLHIGNNKLTGEQVKELKKSLPKCIIEHD